MDELDLLARMRADVPPPDPMTLRRARRRLLDRAVGPYRANAPAAGASVDEVAGPLPADALTTRGSPAGGPRRRPRRPVALRLAVAAGVAVALVGVGVLAGGDRAPYGIGATPAAAEVLNRAADSALRQPAAAAPRPDQYVYRREVGGGAAGATAGDLSVADPAHICQGVHEMWIPVDPDRRMVIRRTGGVVLPPGGTGDPTRMARDPLCEYDSFTADGGVPAEDDYLGPAAVRRLPTDPEALYAHVRGTVADASLVDDATLSELLSLGRTGSPWMTPELTAAVFRAVAYVPGVEHLGSGTDLLGRPGTVVGRTEPARGTRREIVFDPDTGRMLGQRETIVDPQVVFGPPTCAPGTPCATGTPIDPPVGEGTIFGQSVITTTVVDRPARLDGSGPKPGNEPGS
jgi:hypothetical protein